MFQNKLKPAHDEVDPFDSLNDGSEATAWDTLPASHPFEETFSSEDLFDPADVPSDTHFVNPHYVEAYARQDGTWVDGYWRDGDGDTHVDLHVEDGGGYMQSDPVHDPLNDFGSSNDF